MNQKISGLYKGVVSNTSENSVKRTELELRVDVDGVPSLNVISGDFYEKSDFELYQYSDDYDSEDDVWEALMANSSLAIVDLQMYFSSTGAGFDPEAGAIPPAKEDDTLYIENVDIIDGTPLLDIKPYVTAFDAIENARVGWLTDKVDSSPRKKSDDRFHS